MKKEKNIPSGLEWLSKCFDNKEVIHINGKVFVINPLTEQIPATSAEMLRCACDEILKAVHTDFDKVVGEEDKGGIIVAGVALAANKPFGMMRWYPTGITGQIKVPFTCEYIEGYLYLNGIEPGDRVLVVDDMISTGGTMTGMIRALEKAGAVIADIVSVGEKVNYGGAEFVRKETGYDPKTLIKIDVSGEKSRVVDIFSQ